VERLDGSPRAKKGKYNMVRDEESGKAKEVKW